MPKNKTYTDDSALESQEFKAVVEHFLKTPPELRKSSAAPKKPLRDRKTVKRNK